jgi:hypothetical protein
MSFRAKMQLDDASKLMTIEMGKPLPPCRTDSPQGAASSRCKASAGGLLPEPPRTSEGHRDYPAGAAARLAFICDAQAAGLTLAEIRSVLAIRDSGQAPCLHITDLIDQHLAQVERGHQGDVRAAHADDVGAVARLRAPSHLLGKGADR